MQQSKPVMKWAIEALVLLAVAFLFLTVFSQTTSFWRSTYGGDSAIFRLTGWSLAEGQELYVDIWDHKGPMLFFIQWLPQAIWPGRVSIFIMQLLLLFATLLALSSLVRPRVGYVGSAAVVGVYLAFLSYTFEGGNLSEEYSLPFIVLVVYLLTRAVQDPAGATGRWGLWAFPLAGAAFAVVFLIRANNAIPIIGLFSGYFLAVLLRRAPFFRPLLLSLVGFVGVLGATSAWFLVRGTFGEMFRAAITFNLDYTQSVVASGGLLDKPPLFLKVVGMSVALGLVGAFTQFLSRSGNSALGLMGVLFAGTTAYAVLSPSTGYMHYATLVAPLAAYGVITFLDGIGPMSKRLMALGFLLVAAVSLGRGFMLDNSQGRLEAEEAQLQEIDMLLAEVPEDQVEQVFGWDVGAKYFLHKEVLPPHRYYTMQSWWGTVDPDVLTEVIGYVTDEKPQWILVREGGFRSEEMDSVAQSQYELVQSGLTMELYRLRESR